MTIWSPDTCDCKIEYNSRINWVSTIQKCRLHKSLDGQNLLDSVLAQNRRFNLSHGSEPTKEEFEDISTSKHINKERIRRENLDNFHEHVPEHHDLTFFERQKEILRDLFNL